MKRTLFSAALFIAALSLSFCQKAQIESVPEVTGVPFNIVASYTAPEDPSASPASKTVNSGLDTKWAESDGLTVFHAAAGSTSYTKDGQFTISDPDSDSFSGSLSEALTEDSSYDWYALYPYTGALSGPSSTSEYISVASASQTQSGNSSKAHLAGETFPLWGKAEAVSSAKTPSFTMNQINSVVKLHVTNSSSAPLTVSSVSFTAPEEIAGKFAVNFAGSSLSFTPKTSDVSSTVTLEVLGGEAIAVGGSADFYLALKPFTASSGSSLKFSVNGFESEKQLSKAVVFTSGYIKPVSFNYNPAEPEIVINQKYASANGYECALNEKTLPLETTLPEGYTASQIAWSSSNTGIATVADGVVSYAGGFGEVTITAAIDGLKSGSITLNVPCGLVRETFHNSAHYSFTHAAVTQNNTSTSSVWNDGYLSITTYQQDANKTKQRADIKCTDTPITLHAGNYPIIAVKIDDVKDLYSGTVTDRNFKPDFVGTATNEDGTTTEYKKFANESNNAYKSSYKCSDGSYVYVYDLTAQKFNIDKGFTDGALAPTDRSMSFKTFSFKYADIATVSTQITYKLYWIQTFKSKDAVKAYIQNVDNLTYTVAKGE